MQGHSWAYKTANQHHFNTMWQKCSLQYNANFESFCWRLSPLKFRMNLVNIVRVRVQFMQYKATFHIRASWFVIRLLQKFTGHRQSQYIFIYVERIDPVQFGAVFRQLLSRDQIARRDATQQNCFVELSCKSDHKRTGLNKSAVLLSWDAKGMTSRLVMHHLDNLNQQFLFKFSSSRRE